MAAGAIAQAVDVGRSMGMPKRVILGGRGEGSSRKDGEDHGEDGERDEQSMHASLHRHVLAEPEVLPAYTDAYTELSETQEV